MLQHTSSTNQLTFAFPATKSIWDCCSWVVVKALYLLRLLQLDAPELPCLSEGALVSPSSGRGSTSRQKPQEKGLFTSIQENTYSWRACSRNCEQVFLTIYKHMATSSKLECDWQQESPSHFSMCSLTYNKNLLDTYIRTLSSQQYYLRLLLAT